MEKYFEVLNIIKEEDLDITKLYLLSCLNTEDEELALEQMNYCYEVWLEADVDINLSRLADIVIEYWDEIQNDDMTSEDIIEEILDI